MGFFGYRPREDLISRMEQRAKEVLLLPLTETFDGKSLCKLLRAYTNMGRQPAEELWGLLEQRMEELSLGFEPRGVATALFTFAKLARMPGVRVLSAVLQRLEEV